MHPTPLLAAVDMAPPIPFTDEEIGIAAHEKHSPSVRAIAVDEIGLVSPAVARRRLEGSGWYADVARSERPDWLVVRASFVKAGDVFAGRGAPFRAGAERESLLTRYTVAAVIDTASHDLALAVLRRIR